jgi:hypothetical protein
MMAVMSFLRDSKFMAMALPAWYSRSPSGWQSEGRSLGRKESFGKRDEPGVQPGPPGSVLDLGFFLVGRFLVAFFGVILIVIRVVFELLVVGRLGFLILVTRLLNMGTRAHLANRLFRIDLTIDVCHADLRRKPSK